MQTTQYYPQHVLHVDASGSYIPTQIFMAADQHVEKGACSCASLLRGCCCSCDGMACLRCLNCIDSEGGTSCLDCVGAAAGSLCACISAGQ